MLGDISHAEKIYLACGYTDMRKSIDGLAAIVQQNFQLNPFSTFVSGLILQFVNPKIYIYCIVSMEAYILPHFHGEWNILVLFALLLAFIGFVCTLCWSLFGSAFRLLFSKYAKITNTVMALLLVYCAVSLFL